MPRPRLPGSFLAALGVAAVLAVLGRTTGAGLLVVVAFVRLHLVLWPRWDRAVDDAIARFARAIGHGLEAVLLGVLALVTVVPIGLAQRLLGIDGLRPHGAAGWHPLGRPAASEPTTLWSTDRPDAASRSGTARVLRIALVAVAAGLVAALLQAVAEPGERSSATVIAATQSRLPDRDQLGREEGEAFAALEPDPDTGWRLPATFRGELVNVRDGHRVSTGSVSGAPVVWFFGGSALWGSDQRDQGTIASQFAAQAAAAGTPVQVVNWGVSGYVSAQEAAAFERALATEAAPDLVVFYDGFNDVAVGAGAVVDGLPPGTQLLAPLPALERDPVLHRGTGSAPEHPTMAEAAASITAAHARSMDRARHAAEAAGIPVVQAWQPSAFTAMAPDDSRLAELGYSARTAGTLAALHQAVAAAQPGGTIDLTDALDDAPEVFVDQVHTDEDGARRIARRLLAALEPQLQEAAS